MHDYILSKFGLALQIKNIVAGLWPNGKRLTGQEDNGHVWLGIVLMASSRWNQIREQTSFKNLTLCMVCADSGAANQGKGRWHATAHHSAATALPHVACGEISRGKPLSSLCYLHTCEQNLFLYVQSIFISNVDTRTAQQ